MSRARSSRPVCIEPITTRLRSVVKPRSNGDNRCRVGTGHGSCLFRAVGHFVEPVDGAFLGADAAAQHQVLVQRRAAQRARVGKLALLESAVGVEQFGALGAQRGDLSAHRVGVAVRGAADLDREVAGPVVGHRAAAARKRFGDPAGQLGAAGVGDGVDLLVRPALLRDEA